MDDWGSEILCNFFRYYKDDDDVAEDEELQAYINEVSLDGTGPNGGIGRVNMNIIDMELRCARCELRCKHSHALLSECYWNNVRIKQQSAPGLPLILPLILRCRSNADLTVHCWISLLNFGNTAIHDQHLFHSSDSRFTIYYWIQTSALRDRESHHLTLDDCTRGCQLSDVRLRFVHSKSANKTV